MNKATTNQSISPSLCSLIVHSLCFAVPTLGWCALNSDHLLCVVLAGLCSPTGAGLSGLNRLQGTTIPASTPNGDVSPGFTLLNNAAPSLATTRRSAKTPEIG